MSSMIETVKKSIELAKKTNVSGNEFAIQVARTFLAEKCPSFLENELSKDDDRLVKIGRSITALIQTSKGDAIPLESPEAIQKIEKALDLVINECISLMEIHEKCLQVPKVRFGKTNLQMPLMTMGCMRFQQSWNRDSKMMVESMNDVETDNQNNLKKILRYAFKFGINHVETARVYGSSEMQLGVAIKEMIESGEVKREDLIIQTKVACLGTIKSFRETLENSFRMLQMDYFDLTTFHGLNSEPEYKRVFEYCESGDESGEEKCKCLLEVIKEYVAAGKIKHIGFTSHGRTSLIRKVIETEAFSYANIHYHYFGGSYTTTGEGIFGGNLENVRLCNEKDMGLFIISPFDKGGRLYAPSRALRDITLPEMEPINFGALWLWVHDKLDDEAAPIHTITCGVARPSDFDQPMVVAIKELAPENKNLAIEKVKTILERCEKAKEKAVGKEFLQTWHNGILNGYSNTYGAQLGCIAWYSIIIKSFGMVQYSKDRYEAMEGSLKSWNFDKSLDENINIALGNFWGWMPGCAFKPGTDYSPDLKNCPEENRAKLLENIEFAHNLISNNESPKDLPIAWEEAYDMRPWTAWCELPPPKDPKEEETKN